MHQARIPGREFEELAREFGPVNFHAYEWARLAHDAAMRHMVITAKHHDGVAVGRSIASPCNMVDPVPVARDPMWAPAAARGRRGIGVGPWHFRYQGRHKSNGRENTWGFSEVHRLGICFRGKVIPRVRALLTGCGPLSLIWFDTPRMPSAEQVVEVRSPVKSLQPASLINSRIGHNLSDYLQISENAIPIQALLWQQWQVPATLNDTLGWKKRHQTWKEPADHIAGPADTVPKGVNYLLNVGPTAEGVVPEANQRILRTMGSRLEVNAEAIYGTRPSPFYSPDITWRCTTRPQKVYLHLIRLPRRSFRFEGLQIRMRRVWFLAKVRPLRFRQKSLEPVCGLPDKPLGPSMAVLVPAIEDEPPRAGAERRYDRLSDRLDLSSQSAQLRSEDIRHDRTAASGTNFEFAAADCNEPWWDLYGGLDDEHEAERPYACADRDAGRAFPIGVHKRYQPLFQEIRERIEGTANRFVTRPAEGPLRGGPGNRFISSVLPADDCSAWARMRKLMRIRRRALIGAASG